MKRISHLLGILLGALSLGFLGFASFAIIRLYHSAERIRATEAHARIGGPIYRNVIQTKDVLADVLPPPAYIIEAYLTALQLCQAADQAEIERLSAHLTRLQADFHKSATRWRTELEPGALRDAFVASTDAAASFYQIVDAEFLPSLSSGNNTRAREIARTGLLREYDRQRTAIDTVVVKAAEQDAAGTKQLQTLLADSEREVTAELKSTTGIVLAAVGLVLAGTLVVGWRISRRISRSLASTAGNLADAAEQLSGASRQVSASSQSLATGSSRQAASLEETSASLEELAGMTKANTNTIDTVTGLAKQTRAAADAGVADMKEMATAMDALKRNGDEIAKIIQSIDAIAFQTNILALNAAVEAARAGEAGLGFAVVADEVRALAHRSAQASKETAAKIEGTINSTLQGVQISQRIEATLGEIASRAREVDVLAAQVATASQEQRSGIDQISRAVRDMDQITQANAAEAEQGASSAEELDAQANAMRDAVMELRQFIDRANSARSQPVHLDTRSRRPPQVSGQAARGLRSRSTA